MRVQEKQLCRHTHIQEAQMGMGKWEAVIANSQIYGCSLYYFYFITILGMKLFLNVYFPCSDKNI